MKVLTSNIFFSFLLFFAIQIQLNAQILTQSNLPILVIDTEGQEVPDEPKITAHLGIIDNGPGQMNNLTDPFNDYDGFIGIELRGQTSQFFPKRPYGFETRNEDGSNNNVSIAGLPEENDWVLHNPFSDKTLIRNALTYTLAGKIMPYAPRTRMVEVVVNGSYEGVYLLTEKIKVDNNRVDIADLNVDEVEGDDLTGGYIIKIDKVNEGDAGFPSIYAPPTASGEQFINFIYHTPKVQNIQFEQQIYINSIIYAFEDALMQDDFSDPENSYRNHIDVSSFIDYLIINELSRNVDGYRLSTYLYKDKDSNDPLLKIGPVWDYNLAFGNADYCLGGSTEGWAYQFNEVCANDFWLIPFWWEKLMSDTTFTNDLITRWNELRTDVFSDENLNFTCDSLANLTTDAANRNYQRFPVLGEYIWPNNFIGNTYQEEVNYMCNWMNERVAWLDEALLELTNVYNPDLAYEPKIEPTISSNDFNLKVYAERNRRVNWNIYDVQGRLVKKIVKNTQVSGDNIITWNAVDVPPGIYFYDFKISNLNEVYSGKLVKF